MSKSWDRVRFREFVLAAAANARLETSADIARAAGVNQGMLSKWLRGVEQPSVDMLCVRANAAPVIGGMHRAPATREVSQWNLDERVRLGGLRCEQEGA